MVGSADMSLDESCSSAGWLLQYAGREPRSRLPQLRPATPVSFKVPRGVCDCHTHVFCDPQRFAFWSGRTYTPETATVKETRALHRALHVERIVLAKFSGLRH